MPHKMQGFLKAWIFFGANNGIIFTEKQGRISWGGRCGEVTPPLGWLCTSPEIFSTFPKNLPSSPYIFLKIWPWWERPKLMDWKPCINSKSMWCFNLSKFIIISNFLIENHKASMYCLGGQWNMAGNF